MLGPLAGSSFQHWDYAAWLHTAPPTAAALERQRLDSAHLSNPHRLVVLAPPNSDLERLFEDLLSQTYTYWRLVASPSSGAAPTRAIRTLLKRDARFCWHEGQSTATGDVLDSVHEEFVVLLEPGVRLPPECLFEVAHVLECHHADMIYADHDWIGPSGRRCDPFFKPDWSPELLLSTDYVGPMRILRTSLLRLIGFCGWHSIDDWWAFDLRATTAADRIVHIPRVLSHRQRYDVTRSSPFSLRLLSEHVRQRHPGAEAKLSQDGQPVYDWPNARRPVVTIVVPTRDRLDLLSRCLASIRTHTAGVAFEIVVVDNRSKDPSTLDYLERETRSGHVRVVEYPHEFNWSAINNIGAAASEADILVFLNNDIEVLDAQWLAEISRWAFVEEVAAVGPLLLRPDGTVQHAGVFFGLEGLVAHPFERLLPTASGPAGRADWYRNVLAVTGACLGVRRSVFRDLGGFDDRFRTLFGDVEFGLRAWEAGYRNLMTPGTRLVHHHGSTRGGDSLFPPRDFLTAIERFGRVIRAGDPYFNPNLSRWSPIPKLRRPDEPDAWAWLRQFREALEEWHAGPAENTPQDLQRAAKRAWDASQP